jgi:uncharacterized membrane protein HdeD (DUF308 family)
VSEPQSVSARADSATPIPYWGLVLTRATVAAIAAIVVTFSADHSAEFGLIVFGVFTIATGAALVAGARSAVTAGIQRTIFTIQGMVGLAVGIAAITLSWLGLPLLILLVSSWAAITGFLELYLGLRSRGRVDHARDWVFAGAFTALFAVVTILIPADFSQAYTGPDDVERFLTAAVIIVGALGAYGAILGIYLVIAALSLKWATKEPPAASAEGSSN